MIPGIVITLCLFTFVLLAVPIAFALALASIIVMVLFGDIDLWNVVSRTYSGMNSFPLQAIPFFMFTGFMMNSSGITDRLIRLSHTVVGRIPGGLAHINIFVSMLFAGNSGSSTADTSGIGSILIPAMIKRGYTRELTVAVTCTSSTMAAIIPPSIMMVIYGSVLGVSVGRLFLAGVLPGIIIAAVLMLLAYWYAVRYDLPRESSSDFREFLDALLKGIAPFGIPVLVVGGLLAGIFTATEAGLVAAVYSLILGMVVYRTVTFRGLLKVLEQTASLTSLIIICIGMATVFAYVIAYYKVPVALEGIVTSTNLGTKGFLFMVLAIFLVVGTFMDATPAILIFMPILAPAADRIGIDPILLAIVAVITLAIGLTTPPYGLCLLIASNIAGISPEKSMRDVGAFILALVFVVALVIIFPELALWLPNAVMS